MSQTSEIAGCRREYFVPLLSGTGPDAMTNIIYASLKKKYLFEGKCSSMTEIYERIV